MIKIKKGEKELVVAKSAFKSLFKNNGWKIVKEKAAKANKEEDKPKHQDPEDEEDWDDEEDDNEKQVDVDKMDMDALKKLAKEKGIDIKKHNSIGDLRKALKEAK